MDSATGSLLLKRGEGLPTPRRYLAVVAVALGTALAVIDGSIVTVALPTLSHDLDVDSSAAVLVVTVYQLVLVMTLLPCSALGNRIGLRRLYQYGQLLFLLSTILCFFARSLPLLLVVRRHALPAPEPHEEPFDVLGAVLCALTFGLIIYGLESAVHGHSPVVSA